ncbi:Branched-chain amino acid transport protein [Paucidesulfovibrio gracilis DSM 16080]|uniref:Branched-chain amino acid transport protein n=1 Tax=Paucidesulfovibrio gracilis DSM 16080 TaxID=1121449 RepID=A0A1T4XBY1_9BACT|nr:AzlD domain-containing protein [Paucidesulfovibrio gracilis]SKA87192.1 Branched-chain amino acid transport protein [Paucidesulfovibrio gracilis DSM 16080]
MSDPVTSSAALGGFQGASLWLLMVACGVVTLASRLSFILIFSKREMPSWLMRGLRYVPPAVLSALVFPAILRPHDGVLDFSLGNYRFLAALAASVVAWRTKNLFWTIVTGMVVLWCLGWLGW